MRILYFLKNILVTLILFIAIETYRGVFVIFDDIYSMNIWMSMSTEDIYIFLACLFIAFIRINITFAFKG